MMSFRFGQRQTKLTIKDQLDLQTLWDWGWQCYGQDGVIYTGTGPAGGRIVIESRRFVERVPNSNRVWRPKRIKVSAFGGRPTEFPTMEAALEYVIPLCR